MNKEGKAEHIEGSVRKLTKPTAESFTKGLRK
jgi:hypothetical protein